jgi:predicted DsbA family dithiol-disulfide isomerase
MRICPNYQIHNYKKINIIWEFKAILIKVIHLCIAKRLTFRNPEAFTVVVEPEKFKGILEMAFKKDVVEIIEPRDVFVGDPKAPVTLEEFGEYESEACAKANEVVKKLLQDYDGKIRFNFRHFPMTKIHQRSLKAGEAAVASAQEGKFWEMHNILFANRKNLGTTSLKLHSKEAGIANKRFLDDLVNAVYGWQVQGDLKEGLDRGVKDVPTFFVNGQRVTGKPTYEELKKNIDQALKKVKKVAPSKAAAKKKS